MAADNIITTVAGARQRRVSRQMPRRRREEEKPVATKMSGSSANMGIGRSRRKSK